MIVVGDLVLVDTSILLKWFHAEGESEVDEARALLDAHIREEITALVLELSAYELGNILVRSLRWPAAQVADQLDDLDSICGPLLIPDLTWHRRTAELASTHDLTFYDAAFAAAAESVGARLVSADQQMLDVGVAVSISSLVADLDLI